MSSAVPVQLERVAVRYGAHTAIRDVSLAIEPGEVHALLGTSGSGKTTLLRAVAGFEPLHAGRIVLGERIVDQAGGSRVPPERRRVGVVFQDYALFPHLDVAGNLAFGMRARDPAAIAAHLARVGLAGFERRAVTSLSGGEQQRVALARALAQSPDVLLLDEPFSNLDPHRRADLREQTLALVREAGVTTLLVTHAADEAIGAADRISVLHDGALLQTADAATLYDEPATDVVARSLGAALIVEAHLRGDRATTSLGDVMLRGARRTSSVAIRPEQVVVTEAPDGVAGRVERRAFAGAWDELTLRLDDGRKVVARVARGAFEGRESLRIAVEGPCAMVDTVAVSPAAPAPLDTRS